MTLENTVLCVRLWDGDVSEWRPAIYHCVILFKELLYFVGSKGEKEFHKHLKVGVVFLLKKKKKEF